MGKYDDLDAFWDLGRLMPKKKKLTPFNTNSSPVEHQISGEQSDNDLERKLTTLSAPRDLGEIEEKSYELNNNGLIKRVTVIRSIDKYDFYGNFRKAAIVYFDYKTDKCDFAPYYSYMPQYSQLTIPQKQYYFYWRDMLRHGKYLKSDYSYLYLYVYEILNLPDLLPPPEGIKMLCKLWSEYRGTLPKIDANFAIWIQDYCLIHRLPCPMEYISEFIFDVIGASSFKEFYLSEVGFLADAGTDAMIAYLSDYDFRRCRYRTTENKAAYTKYMLGAMGRVIEKIMTGTSCVYDKSKIAEITRDAFPRSICTHSVKCRLKIEYTPLSQDLKLRSIVTMAVRYTENKLRAQLGIKSRLAIKDLPEEYKRIIDNYFDVLLYDKSQKNTKENIPEYEALYEAPDEIMSIDGADEIEKASWNTTAKLVSEDLLVEENSILNVDNILQSTEEYISVDDENNESLEDIEEDDFGLSSAEIQILTDIFYGRIGNFDISTVEKIEKINEVFAEQNGDIVIEQIDEGYKIIEDYLEEVEVWLMKIKR